MLYCSQSSVLRLVGPVLGLIVFHIQNVGWRDGSLRIVLILTDAGFKTALDGKVLIYPVVQSMVTLCTRWLDC